LVGPQPVHEAGPLARGTGEEPVEAALRALPARAPRLVLEFTPDIARYMQLADFFIGKPGPGSLSEAVQMRLPVIVVRNRWTLPQERYNAQWVREQALGLVCASFAKVEKAVDELTLHLERYQAATRGIRNEAIVELPRILESILDGRTLELQHSYSRASGRPAGSWESSTTEEKLWRDHPGTWRQA